MGVQANFVLGGRLIKSTAPPAPPFFLQGGCGSCWAFGQVICCGLWVVRNVSTFSQALLTLTAPHEEHRPHRMLPLPCRAVRWRASMQYRQETPLLSVSSSSTIAFTGATGAKAAGVG